MDDLSKQTDKQQDDERDRFYDIDKLIVDDKLFGGEFEYELEADDL